MSEKIPHIGDKLQPLEASELQQIEQLAKSKEEATSDAEKEHGTNEQIETHRKTVEQKAVSGEERSFAERQKPQQTHPLLVNKQLKQVGYERAMTRARKKLSPPSRAFSKVIHNPIVDRPSEFIGKTIARPASMFWGSFFAFVGTSALLWATRYYGYEYNYLLVILLFVGGALAGLALETGWRTIKRR